MGVRAWLRAAWVSLLPILVFALAGDATATDAAKSQASELNDQGKWILGEVIHVGDHDVSISEKDRMVDLQVTRDTDIMVDGRKVSISDLQAGVPVLAAYEGSPDNKRAVRIDVDEATRAKASSHSKAVHSSEGASDEASPVSAGGR